MKLTLGQKPHPKIVRLPKNFKFYLDIYLVRCHNQRPLVNQEANKLVRSVAEHFVACTADRRRIQENVIDQLLIDLDADH
jgi:hypothetical protein